MLARARMTTRFVSGRWSCVNNTEKHAFIPPGTGGVAEESRMHMIRVVMSHVRDKTLSEFSAALIAAHQNITEELGLYRICAKGTPKFTILLLRPNLSMQV